VAVAGLATGLLDGCFMTRDENAWKRDTRTQDTHVDRPADSRGSEGKAPDGRRPDSKLTDGAPDLKKTDLPRVDLARADLPKADLPKVDLPKTDLPKLDLKKPDLPKADLPKTDLPKCTPLTLTVTAAADDGEVWLPNYFYPDGEGSNHELYIGADSGKTMWGYFRFALGQSIPGKATISAATLRVYGVGVWQWQSTMAIEVLAELSADAPVVTKASEAPITGSSARAVTTAVVRWPATGGMSWSQSAWNTAPSVAALLQEVVTKQSGLAAGSHLQLWIRGAQTSSGAVGIADYLGPGYANHPTELSLTYCSP